MLRKRLKETDAIKLGLDVKPLANDGRNPRYSITKEQFNSLKEDSKPLKVENTNESVTNGYDSAFTLTAFNPLTGKMMNIQQYCEMYGLPIDSVKSYKLVSHTGTPYFNIVFKETEAISEETVDIKSIIEKYANNVVKQTPSNGKIKDVDQAFDVLTYTDVHIAMDTNANNTSMYATEWNEVTCLEAIKEMLKKTVKNKRNNLLVVDELGDFLDGFNGYTTRGGHKLPQNMTDEQAFDLGVRIKMLICDTLAPIYDHVIFNNICNDNHAGSFGYFVNSAFKSIGDRKYSNVTITNHRNFINHYIVNGIAFVISHGKDEDTLKFGFKPVLDSKGLEKIDQYCKQNNLYKLSDKVVFKKGDSHQAMFDMATSDDFYYFNYPALSPSSQWVQNNFKKGRRGFVMETWNKDQNVSLNLQLK